MSEYTDKVAEFSPVAFWYLNQLSLAEGMVDLSGNGFHGIFRSDVPVAGPFFGLPSPIETDPASFAIGGMAGYYWDAGISGSPVDVRGAFTLIAWGHNNGSTANKTLLSRVAAPAFSGYTGINITGGGNAQASIAFDDGGGGSDRFPLTDPTEIPLGHFPMIAVVRDDAIMQLYTDAVLVAQRVDLPLGDLVWAPYNNGGWKVGYGNASDSATTGATGSVFQSSQTCSAIIIPTALTASELLEIYEAAKNLIALRGLSAVIPTGILYSAEPVTPVGFPFRHNWSEKLIERFSFRTDVSHARTGAEEGNGLRTVPRREFEFVQLLRTNAERRRLRALLWPKQHQPWFVPVRQHAEQLTSTLTVGTITTPVSTQYRDYEVGGYIGFRQVSDTGEITHWEERLITAVNLNDVEHEALANDYDANVSWVYPVRRALLTPSVSPRGITDRIESITLTARLLPEDEAAVPHRIVPWTRTLAYRDYEVWDISLWPSHDWSEEREYEVEREVDEIDFETGRFSYDSDAPGAAETIPMRLILNGEEQIARFLGWFHERKGQLRYLWVPTVQEDFEILAVDGADLTVADTNYSDAFALAEPRRDLAFVYNDGTMHLRRVLSFAGTPDETLTLDATVPTLTNLRCVSLLKFCRLDADQIELAYETDSVAVVAFSFRELLHSPEGEGRSSLSPSASQSTSLSASHSPSPSASESPSPSGSVSPSPSSSISVSISPSPSSSVSQSASVSPSSSGSASPSASASTSPSSSESRSTSPSASPSPSV